MRSCSGLWAIWSEKLCKEFGGIRAVDGADLRVPTGRIYGFVGPNGSGKTTAVAMMLGLIRPTSGELRVLGHRPGCPRFHEVLKQVGALVQAPAFYPHLSGRDNLRLMASVRGWVDRRAVDRALERVGLAERARDRYATYSLGMRQRLAIALALLDDPRLVILDEPTNGLDPVGIREVRALIRELGEEGRTVFLSSHLLHEVEQVCDEVGIIVRGRLVAQGPVASLLGHRGVRVRVAEAGDGQLPLAGSIPGSSNGQALALARRAAQVVRSLPGRPRVEVADGALWVDVAASEWGAELTRVLARAGLWVTELVPVRSTLEQYFFQVAMGASDVESPEPPGEPDTLAPAGPTSGSGLYPVSAGAVSDEAARPVESAPTRSGGGQGR